MLVVCVDGKNGQNGLPMAQELADLLEELDEDPMRAELKFSPDIDECHVDLFNVRRTRLEKVQSLNAWVGKFQPCLFGRMEAKQRRIHYCLINENDIEKGDTHIQRRIQEDRLMWKRGALYGQSHSFIIAVISPRLAYAQPGDTLLRFSKRVCGLYLGMSAVDEIYLDSLILDIKSKDFSEVREWKVGSNFFAAQGDRRWWHDHRIPGGIALSMNSVGHMARSRVEADLARGAIQPGEFEGTPRQKLVYWALPTAMKTIGPPAQGSVRGAWLAERGDDEGSPPYDPNDPKFRPICAYSENTYKGHYHTDFTMPSEYFRGDVGKPDGLSIHTLYFTYLHSPADEDYRSMGLGELPRGQISAPNDTGLMPPQSAEGGEG